MVEDMEILEAGGKTDQWLGFSSLRESFEPDQGFPEQPTVLPRPVGQH